MDYEQRYKEALDEAKAIHKIIKKDLKPVIEQIFPELKESEDEQIRKEDEDVRKWLISQLEIKSDMNNSCELELMILKSIAWLEKQEKETSEKEFTFKSLPRLLEMIEVSDRAKAYTEKLAVTLDNEGYHTDAKIIRERIKIMNGEEVHMATMDEQKPIDKVEPKFNLYDWVVTDKGDVVQIGAVNNGYYTLFNGMDFNISYVDKCWHRWTIQDAKDGDVLRLGGVIAIFKKYIGQEKCICYCSFCGEGNGFEIPIENGEDNVYGCTDTTPATKEQRDTLFEEMKLEGYRWDEDKKKVIQFERFVRRKESNFDFEEDENGVIKFVHEKN